LSPGVPEKKKYSTIEAPSSYGGGHKRVYSNVQENRENRTMVVEKSQN
jgi:hypothetical protein